MTSAHAVSPPRPASRAGALALLLVGAALVAVGILQTTTSRLTSVGCPSGTTLIAKFEYQSHRYVFVAPSGNEHVVTISNGNADGGNAHSSVPIKAVVVKGGNDSKTTWYTPAQTDLHFSNDGLSVGHGNKPDISNVQFCRSTTPPTTTTEPVTTPPETTPPVTTPETTPETTPPETTPPTSPQTSAPVTSPETSAPVTSPETSAPVTSPQTSAPATSQPAVSTTTSTSVAQEPVVVSTSTTIVTASNTSLPHTGAPSAALIALGTVLMVSGGSLMIIGRARERRANS